jgi:hypothetical protein
MIVITLRMDIDTIMLIITIVATIVVTWVAFQELTSWIKRTTIRGRRRRGRQSNNIRRLNNR